MLILQPKGSWILAPCLVAMISEIDNLLLSAFNIHVHVSEIVFKPRVFFKNQPSPLVSLHLEDHFCINRKLIISLTANTKHFIHVLHLVRMMLGVSSIVPNTNIDGNDLHDCVK